MEEKGQKDKKKEKKKKKTISSGFKIVLVNSLNL